MSHEHHAGCQWFEKVWNARDRGAIDELTGPGMQAHGADGQTRSAEGFKQFHELLIAALPDLHVEVINCVRGRDFVCVQWKATGTPATHGGEAHPIEVPGLSLMRIEGDKIVEGWDSYDIDGLMRRLQAAGI